MDLALQSIKYNDGSLEILNQLLLPFITKYESVRNSVDGHQVIKSMKVRGAPAIAIVSILSLSVELKSLDILNFTSKSYYEFILQKLTFLKTSRPTAVNMFKAIDEVISILDPIKSVQELQTSYLQYSENMLKNDIRDNKSIAKHGSDYIIANSKTSYGLRVLTHCNTGSLATAGWGTALGIIRNLNQSNALDHCFYTETRPYNQGARLTAYELLHEQIPSTLICDSMVSWLLKLKNIDAVVVGADRVAANGDSANKIGTYQLAIAAKYHNVMFIVAAPTTSIDLQTLEGSDILIEDRPSSEVTSIKGFKDDEHVCVEIAARGIEVWNPAFDVVPASLITCIVTERGVIKKINGSAVFKIPEFLGGR